MSKDNKEINKERFCIITVTLRKDKWNRVTDLKEICKKLHKHPGVKVSWMPDIDTLRTREDLIKELMSYHDKYGDEVTIDLAASTILYNKQGIRKVIDEGMSKLKNGLGSYPGAVGAAHLTTDALYYLNRKYGVEIAEAFLWEQMGVDGYSTDGGINGPYYPAGHHTLVPARNEKERVNVVVLDGWSREFFETKYPYTSCMAPHPWDANLVACDGAAFMKYMTDLFLKDNLVRNTFGIFCMRVELDWINQTFWTYNKHRQMKARFFEWVDYMFSAYPDIHYATLTEFNSFFRSICPDNGRLLYKYLERSKYEPNRRIYWYFCKGYRIAVEW